MSERNLLLAATLAPWALPTFMIVMQWITGTHNLAVLALTLVVAFTISTGASMQLRAATLRASAARPQP